MSPAEAAALTLTHARWVAKEPGGREVHFRTRLEAAMVLSRTVDLLPSTRQVLRDADTLAGAIFHGTPPSPSAAHTLRQNIRSTLEALRGAS